MNNDVPPNTITTKEVVQLWQHLTKENVYWARKFYEVRKRAIKKERDGNSRGEACHQ